MAALQKEIRSAQNATMPLRLYNPKKWTKNIIDGQSDFQDLITRLKAGIM